jgi:Tol biopolymer transport system component
MTLAAGSRLGPYEILSPLGAGGMGEVYKARDGRLKRDVAVKVLPSAFAAAAERLRRFEQEAQAASALNHPNILAIYDLGEHEGAPYIVSELLEGETLRSRLAGGAFTPRRAIGYAMQVASGLAAAHEKGIVHRDLKPENIFVTNDGRLKILDFGLARVTQAEGRSGTETNLPTLAPGTEPGMVLGTLGYMSPEQLRGRPADARSDIFSFGAILYEMLSGRRAFHGDSAADTMSAILTKDPPDLTETNRRVPESLDRIVRHCLEKNPEARFHSASDVAFDLEAVSSLSGEAIIAPAAPRRLRAWFWPAAAVLAVAALVATWIGPWRPRASKVEAESALRANILLPENVELNDAVISPDGSRIVFSGTDRLGKVQLWVRPLDAYKATPLPGSDGGVLPFWSPDSRSIAFFADKKLKRIDASGGSPLTLYDVDGVGGAWAPSGDILFAPPAGPIYRLPPGGGKAAPVTRLDASKRETAHRYPFVLPDGRHFLYLALNLSGNSRDPANRIWVGSLDGSPAKPLVPANFNAQYASGYLLFIRGGDGGGSLLAQAFDPVRLEVSGEPVTVVEQVGRYTNFMGYSDYSVSSKDTLVFDAFQLTTRLEWLDRGGKKTGTFGEPAAHFNPRISRDGSKIAFELYDPVSNTTQVWLGDIARNLRTRLTSGPGSNTQPVWSPDGTRIAYTSDRKHQSDAFVRLASGGGEEAITDEDGQRTPQDWSKDGRLLVCSEREAAGSRLMQIATLSVDAPHKLTTVLPRAPNDFGAVRVSPDGRWLAYDLDESGRREVYVVSFPDGQGKVQISDAGGVGARWARGGKELLYTAFDGTIMSVTLDTSHGLRPGAPKPLFKLPEGSGSDWDVSADGERFLLNVPVVKSSSLPLSVVFHWAAGLKK